MLNLRETDTSKIFVTSDLHLGHLGPVGSTPIWESRGYIYPAHHDANVIRIINETVRSTDTLIFLGDFCLNTKIEQFEQYIGQIQCQNILFLWGNHNNPHEKQVYRKEVEKINKICGVTSYTGCLDLEIYPLRYKNIVYMGHKVECVLHNQYVVLCHYPIWVWNEMKHGAWMLCGHSHYSFPQTRSDNKEGKILDVGWDGHGKPWSLQEIADVMNTKQVIGIDHHQ